MDVSFERAGSLDFYRMITSLSIVNLS